MSNGSTEAHVVIWTKIIHPPTQVEMVVTLRGDEIDDTWDEVAGFVLGKVEKGWVAVTSRDGDRVLQQRIAKKRAAVAQAERPQAPQQDPTAGPTQPSGPPPATPRKAPSPVQEGDVKSGTDKLNKITVTAEGKVEFHVGKFQWPFKDSRGGEVVAALFDEDLGWSPEHFYPGAKYEEDVTGLLVDWAKPGKYYDVLRVHS